MELVINGYTIISMIVLNIVVFVPMIIAFMDKESDKDGSVIYKQEDK
jgi:hypothetical protein